MEVRKTQLAIYLKPAACLQVQESSSLHAEEGTPAPPEAKVLVVACLPRSLYEPVSNLANSAPQRKYTLFGRSTDVNIGLMKASYQKRSAAAKVQKAAAIEGDGKEGTVGAILCAAQVCLCQTGYAGLSTRRVAELAQVPLSQIHYHFGSKQNLVLALLADQNERLLMRQAVTFAEAMPLSKRWERACDYLDEDISSGYVRVLQEMIAAGWSDPLIAAQVRKNLQGWYDLLTSLAREAGERLGGLGPFSAAEVACLVGTAFNGSETVILLGMESAQTPARSALRKFGNLIHLMEGAAKKSAPSRSGSKRTAVKNRSDK